MSGETCYRLFGLIVKSELSLPEALIAPAGVAAHVFVRRGEVDPGGITGARRRGPFVWAAAGVLWFSVPDVARFLVRDGREIIVDARPGVDEDRVRAFLLGSAMGALLAQRGTMVLHGNAIVDDDGCLACVGPSGAGKSTLAAEFMRRGHQVLSDDLVPLDEECRVLPGIPRLKLLPDAVARLQVAAEELRPIRPGLTKFDYPLGAAFATQAIPLRVVYVLARGGRDPGITITTLRGMECLVPLRANTYRVGFVDALGLLPDHLDRCGRLARQAQVKVVSLPSSLPTPAEVVDALLADAAGDN